MEEGKCNLLGGVEKKFDGSKLLGSEPGVDPASRDGGEGHASRVGEDEAAGSGEGGGRGACRDDWLGHTHAEQADSEGDSE